jgi:GNAT superfamily N-acetyltransferase
VGQFDPAHKDRKTRDPPSKDLSEDGAIIEAMECRLATPQDAPVLGHMNQQLIRDEGHRNRMSPAELEQRMARFLKGEYTAILFEDGARPLGYALYKRDADGIYPRQFFVLPEQRRKGIGRAAFQWLQSNVWQDKPRIRIEVLTGNAPGIAFWRSMGFANYCITMELDRA